MKTRSLFQSGLFLFALVLMLSNFTFREFNIVQIEKTVESQRGDNPTLTKKFTLNGAGDLDVTTSGGSIKVEGQNGNEVEVQVFVKKKNQLLEATDALMDRLKDEYNFKIEKNGNQVIVFSKREGGNWSGGWNNNNLSISYKIFVPHAMTSNLKTSGGSIHASDVIGAQELRTSGGSIKLADVDGEVLARTSGGSINVNHSVGNMDLHTSGGRISVTDSKGQVKGRTSGGTIKVANIEGPVDVHTSGGSVHVNGHMQYVKAGTSGGSIKVDMTGLKDELDLHTSGGSIHAYVPAGLGMDLYLKGNDVDVDLRNFNGTAKKGKVEGSMNGGGIPVKMTTSGGNVDLIFRGASQ